MAQPNSKSKRHAPITEGKPRPIASSNSSSKNQGLGPFHDQIEKYEAEDSKQRNSARTTRHQRFPLINLADNERLMQRRVRGSNPVSRPLGSEKPPPPTKSARAPAFGGDPIPPLRSSNPSEVEKEQIKNTPSTRAQRKTIRGNSPKEQTAVAKRNHRALHVVPGAPAIIPELRKHSRSPGPAQQSRRWKKTRESSLPGNRPLHFLNTKSTKHTRR